MEDPDFHPPVNPMPATVTLLFLALAGIEVVLSLAEAGIMGTAVGLALWRLKPIPRFLEGLNILIGMVFVCGAGIAFYHMGVEEYLLYY